MEFYYKAEGKHSQVFKLPQFGPWDDALFVAAKQPYAFGEIKYNVTVSLACREADICEAPTMHIENTRGRLLLYLAPPCSGEELFLHIENATSSSYPFVQKV